MNTTRLAIIGMGKIARDQHLPAIAGDPRFELVAAVSPHSKADGVPTFQSFDALLADGPGVDAVAICTPPQVRGQVAKQAIAAGLHVFLEKPPTATLSELRAIADQGRAAGVTLFASWHSREAPMVEAARDWLSGRVVTGGHVHWREDVRRWHPGQTWLWEPGGLGVFDPAINAFSILTAILPQPPFVRDAALHIPENAHTPIQAQLTLGTGGAALSVDLDFLQTGPQTWEIALEVEGGERLLLESGGASMTVGDGEPQTAPEREYPRLYGRFGDLIAAGESDVDAAPLRLVADALLVGARHQAPAFIE